MLAVSKKASSQTTKGQKSLFKSILCQPPEGKKVLKRAHAFRDSGLDRSEMAWDAGRRCRVFKEHALRSRCSSEAWCGEHPAATSTRRSRPHNLN
jgi:hypothetical protein